ncbi:MAG: hypothetical protein ACRDQX_01350 [Pseudonocardiaceae bacterium]
MRKRTFRGPDPGAVGEVVTAARVGSSLDTHDHQAMRPSDVLALQRARGNGQLGSTGILALQRSVGNAAVVRLLESDSRMRPEPAQRVCVEGHKGEANPEWGKHKEKAHYYVQEFPSCRKGEKNCDFASLFKAHRLFPAPGSSGASPVSTGDTTSVPVLGQVKHTVDESQGVVKNTTVPGHLLDSGEVEITVVETSEGFNTRFTGYGTGRLGGLNSLFSRPLWSLHHTNIKEHLKKDMEDK